MIRVPRGIDLAIGLASMAGAALLFDCKPPPDDRNVQRNVGVLCVGATRSDAGTGEVVADQPVPIVVRTLGCLDSCTRDRTATCSVKRDGQKLVVTSEIAWHSKDDSIGKACAGECTVMEASCLGPGLGAGTYTVELGTTHTEIQVPSQLAGPCVGAPGTAPKTVIAVASAPPPPPPPPDLVPSLPVAPATGAPPVPLPPGDGFCITPFESKIKNKGSVAVTLTRPNLCVASSCTTAKAKCSIKKEKGNRLVVTSTMPIAEKAKPRTPCTEDCPSLLASCRIDGLPPGTYSIEQGETKKSVAVPLAKEVCLP